MKLILLLLLSITAFCSSYKIVFLVPEMSNSQILFNKRVAEVVANAGHDVTMVVLQYFNDNNRKKVDIDKKIRIHNVNASTGYRKEDLEKMQAEVIYEDLNPWDAKYRKQMSVMSGLFSEATTSMVNNKEFLQWLENEKFDLAFSHMYHASPIGIIHAAKIPAWIWLNSGALMDYVATTIGVPIIPSYVPPMMMESQDRMTFYERTKSLLGHSLMYVFWPRMVAGPETKTFRQVLGEDFPDLIDLARNCSLVMVNSNELYDLPRPSLAKVVNIGGVGVQLKDAKPLPKEFADIVSRGDGTVILSFGSVAPCHHMPLSWKNAFLEAFRKLPNYQFVIRYEGTDLNDRLPSNVHLFKWLPQADLLQHPRVKGMITHGGYNTLQEAIAAGKPLVMIALFGDQPKNSKIAEKHGMAVSLKKSHITESTVHEALTKILTNPSYAQKAGRLSEMVRNQPTNKEELVVRWTEFVAKFQNLDNLVPAGQDLNFVQYHSLDVIAFLASIVLFVFFVIFKLLICCCRCLCCKFKKQKIE